MRINQLELQNFRLFADSRFSFPAPFTVLIGENGRGKSALLHGLRVAAGAWLLGFRETERLHIEPEDIRRVDTPDNFSPQFPTLVRASGVVEGQQTDWARQRNDFKGGMGRTGWAEAKPLIELARQCDQATNDNLQNVPLPVLVFFSTARLWVGAKREVALKTKGSRIEDGYAQALTPDHRRKGPSSRTRAMGWIKRMYFQALEEGRWPDAGPSAGPGVRSGAAVLLKAVLEALATCLPGWTDLRWDSRTDDLSGLYQRPDGSAERVPLYYLSDGLRTMAGMVAEIAYRCATLNGHLGKEAVRQSKGLVLIDELDMHLHPNWQRHVVRDLKTAFPNLQFVVTTHSPFIVQSLDSTELINLDFVSDAQPKDLRLEDVATEVMNVESEFGIENEQQEALAAKYLDLLKPTIAGTMPDKLAQASAAQLNALEDAVSDPGLRALLRLQRLRKTV